MATLLSCRDAILAGIDTWMPYIDMACLDEVLGSIPLANVAPPPDLIFEAFRYRGPADIVALILGQDPYPTPGDAQGLCFSAPRGAKVPKSLVIIFDCLEAAALRKPRKNNDLRPWAVQGVLMLNAALTTTCGVRGAHRRHWAPFLTSFLGRLFRRAAPLHALLWGGDARAFAKVARAGGHHVHEWSHPSPLGDNPRPPAGRFVNCPHFADVNAALAAAGRPPIVWDNDVPITAFADGACIRNGAPDAQAGFGVAIIGGHFGDEKEPTVLAGRAASGRLRRAGGKLFLAPVAAAQTNVRAEYLAIIHALDVLIRGRAVGAVELVSDYDTALKTLSTWYPRRAAAQTATELKNLDLITIAAQLLEELRAQADVTLTHTYSHQPRPPPDAPPRAQLLWLGNHRADELAAIAIWGNGMFSDGPLAHVVPRALPALAAEPVPLAPVPLARTPAPPIELDADTAALVADVFGL